jgi:hypothetical protein
MNCYKVVAHKTFQLLNRALIQEPKEFYRSSEWNIPVRRR